MGAADAAELATRLRQRYHGRSASPARKDADSSDFLIMYLSGLTHRDRLFDVAMRWLADRLHRDDGRVLTEIFAFERAITAPTVRRFVADLCRVCRREDLYLERTTNKDQLREAIVAAAAHPTSRVAELIDWYRQLPEEFFPRTPVRMSIVTLRNGRLAAVIRRKRIRRVADKVSRRVAAQLTAEVESVARALTASRPRNVETVVNNDRPPSAPAGIRGAAERLVADRIRSGRIVLDPDKQRVDDVIGAKVIAGQDEIPRIEAALDDLDYAWAHDREVHDDCYRGIHYLVDLELPPDQVVLDNMRAIDWSFAAGRGLPVSELGWRFRDYLESCNRTFRVELILTTYEDLVESEFGICIHEQRILDQRDVAADYSRLAQNASSIMEYMLRLATSPTVDIDELPFKIWGRYIRDTVAHKIAALGDGEPIEWLVPSEHLDNLMPL